MDSFRLKTLIFFGALSIGLLPITSCNQEPDFEYFVQADLQPYFDKFLAEGVARGKQLDMHTISGMLGELPGTNVLGRCAQSAENGTITIDEAFWNKASTYEREYVVFHELGHCILDRRHLEDQHPDGTCVSMMQSGSGGCRMAYNAQTRSGYLDELFK